MTKTHILLKLISVQILSEEDRELLSNFDEVICGEWSQNSLSSTEPLPPLLPKTRPHMMLVLLPQPKMLLDQLLIIQSTMKLKFLVMDLFLALTRRRIMLPTSLFLQYFEDGHLHHCNKTCDRMISKETCEEDFWPKIV